MASTHAGTVRCQIRVAFFALLSLTSCDKAPPASPDSGASKDAIYEATTRIVSGRLKAPASAKFPSLGGVVSIVDLGTDRFQITGYVDSQNSFGAMIRTRWVARVSVLGESVTAEEIAIGDDAVLEFGKELLRKKQDADRATYLNSPQYKAEHEAKQKQMAANRLEVEQRAEGERLAKEKKDREAEVQAKAAEQQRQQAEQQRRQTEERAAAWNFPRDVTTTAAVQMQSRFGLVTIPAGTKVKATEARQGMVRIEHSGSTVLVAPATVGLPPRP